MDQVIGQFKLDYLNAQGQPKYVWPASFSLARAYVDQLERSKGLSASGIASVRRDLNSAEAASGSARQSALRSLAKDLDERAGSAADSDKVKKVAAAVRDLGM